MGGSIRGDGGAECGVAGGVCVAVAEVANFHPKPLHPRHIAQDMGGHLRNPVLLAAYLIAGGNFLIFLNQYSYITFVLADAPYHLSPHALGLAVFDVFERHGGGGVFRAGDALFFCAGGDGVGDFVLDGGIFADA